jgi:hypothetical protein
MILKVCWDGLQTLSYGLSQFHGHGSWLVCEVVMCLLLGHEASHRINFGGWPSFGDKLPRPLDLDGPSVKPPKAKPNVQTHFIFGSK